MHLYIVINFGELFLKGKNISFFEKILLKNLKKAFGELTSKIDFEKKSGGSFYLKIDSSMSDEEMLEIEEKIGNTFGIASFYKAYFVDTSLEKIFDVGKFIVEQKLKKNKNIKTFAISSTRVDKGAELSSREVNIKLGSEIWKFFEKKQIDVSVDLDNPDLKIYVKIKKNKSFLFTETKRGLGGLPVGSTGKAIVFFSGGIDSPVAGFYALKRGLEIVAVHFHSVPRTSPKSIEKVKSLVSVLTKFQPNIKLYLVPIIDIQKDIVENAKRNLSIILQRRAFLKLGEELAKQENVKAFVTGDSLGQVASQTLENMTVISEASSKIIIRPLVCFDKSDIKDVASKIGTLEISELPHEDACSLFTPKSPETKANLSFTVAQEQKLNKNLFKKALEDLEVVEIKN